MTRSADTVPPRPRSTYRNEVAYPFCPGCGHHTILDRLDEALVALAVDPKRLVLVTDIGCSGLSDQYFTTSAFHGLHGRSLTYATGLKLARPELEVVVIIGDGGTGIGGAHLLNAARRNIGLTLLVFNNLNFGMTGGQHSTTTPEGAFTSTTPAGNPERPLDLCATVAANGAAYVWRGTSFDADLAERMAEAVRTPGFAMLDVWELCTAFFVPANKASKRTLTELMDRFDFQRGVVQRREVEEYARRRHREVADTEGGRFVAGPPGEALEPRFESPLDRRFRLVVAGAAGARVRSSSRQLTRAAVLSGLWASQRDDYPVTVKTGHSVAHLVLGPEPVDYAGAPRPDAVLVLSPEGRKAALPLLARMGSDGVVYHRPDLGDLTTRARLVPLDVDALIAAAPERVPKGAATLVALAAVVTDLGLVPSEALEESVRHGHPDHAEANLAAVRAGAGWRAADG